MIRAPFIALVAVIVGVSAAAAQQPEKSEKPSTTPAAMTLTGCVSDKPGRSGQYMFQEADGLKQQFRLNGKDIKKYAGLRVEVVAGSPSGKGLSIRGGLWPSPNAAAQAGALDPAQESIARQPGGANSGAGAEVPELRVTRLRLVEGSCE